jgi:hypothetical protein
MPRKSAKPRPETRPSAAAPPNPTECADFGRDSVAAALDSSAAFNAGVEAIRQEVVGYANASFENAGETVRALLSARTFEDVVQLQTDFAKRNFEGWMERTAKLSELGYSLVSATVGSWSKPAPR